MKIDKDEVLRYLGHKNQDIDDELNNLIDLCILEIKETSKPLYTYKVFDIEKVKDGISVLGTNLILKGKDIFNHLKDARKCVIMAATLGINVDNKIRITERTNMTKSVILDSCATEFIEKTCDKAEEEIIDLARSKNFKINFRYGPGYGDLPIEIQGEIIGILNANKSIGLTSTASSILIPRKSVTAIIGFLDEDAKINKKKNCNTCNLRETCNFRREGGVCGS